MSEELLDLNEGATQRDQLLPGKATMVYQASQGHYLTTITISKRRYTREDKHSNTEEILPKQPGKL